MGIRHFQVVAEYVIKGNFQRRNAGSSTFLFLYLVQVFFPVVSDLPQVIQLFIQSVLDHVSFLDTYRRFFFDVLPDDCLNVLRKLDILEQLC